jgi:uncharacterized protein (TIGR02996 family)
MKTLLQAILDSPDDDEPRLVLADALMEQGDPRGDFIRVQCALGRTLHGAKGRAWSRPTGLEREVRKALEQRERIALRKHQKTWLEPFRAPLRTWAWSRGFVEEAVCDAGKYLAGARRIFENTPLQKVKLTATSPAQLQAVIAHPTTPRLRSLNLYQQKIGVEGATAIASGEGWATLRELVLYGNHLEDPAAARALAKSRMPALRALDVGESGLTDDGVVALAEAPFFRQLTSFSMGWSSGLSPRAMEAIARNGTALERLDLASTGADQAAVLFASAPTLKALRWLRLDRHTSSRSVAALVDSPHLTNLAHLEGVTLKPAQEERLERRQA